MTEGINPLSDPMLKCDGCGHPQYKHESNGITHYCVELRDDLSSTTPGGDPSHYCDCNGFDSELLDRPVGFDPNQTKGNTSMTDQKTYLLPGGREYITRPLAGFENDVEGLRWLVGNGVHVLLLGDPGCGKTALMQAAFPNAHNEIMHSRMTAFDMKWLPRPILTEDGQTSVVFDPAPLTRAALAGEPVYVDEIMRGGDDAFTPLFSAMDGRGIIIGGNQDGTDLSIKEGFGVVAASNPMVRGAFLPDAIASRFFILEVQVTAETLRRLGISEALMTIWNNLSGQAGPSGTEMWVPSVRDLLTAQRFIDLGKKQAAAFAITGFRVPAIHRDKVASVVGLTLGVRVGAEGGVIK